MSQTNPALAVQKPCCLENPGSDSDAEKATNQFLTFITVLYLVEGWASPTGILQQPLRRFCAEVQHWNAYQIESYLSWLMMPWVIKPVYGYISDAFPLFGYRRKSYLILVNIIAAAAFLLMASALQPTPIFVSLMLISFGLAVSSALCGGLLVETGQSSGQTTKFCSQQTLFANIANVSAALLGGWLCQYLNPTNALQLGSVLTSLTPLAVVWVTIACITEKPSKGGHEQRVAVWKGIREAIHSTELWLVLGFLILWAFSPGFGTPMYMHMVKNLHFSQNLVGQLEAWHAGGAAAGAIAFRLLAPRVTINTALVFLIVVGASVQYCFVYMQTEPTAILLNVANGAMTAAAGLAVHVVAANKCPRYAEGFLYGFLFSVVNFTHAQSRRFGADLYDNYFHQDMNALIAFTAGTTLLCLVIVPFINFSKEGGHSWFQLARQRWWR